ncbi:PhzF family phenazine biosynthesis protein, partial [Pseudomonas aeruginosa]
MSRRYWQLDVFAERPLTGNGLAVFDDASALDDAAMQAWTRELRQFESIFLLPGDDPRAFRARIFTLEEELPFAGHPLLGAAALLHHLRGGDNEQHWTLHLA